MMNDATFFTRVGLNLLIRQTNAEPLVRMTAKEFMFGYKSTLLSLGNKFMPSWIYFDKLGLIDRVSSIILPVQCFRRTCTVVVAERLG